MVTVANFSTYCNLNWLEQEFCLMHYVLSLSLSGDKGDTIKASYVHHLDQLKKSTAVGEIIRRFSSNENTFTVGGSYAVDHLTVVKAKLNNHGRLAALLQHEVIPKSLLTISGEIETKALDKNPRFGLAIALKPWWSSAVEWDDIGIHNLYDFFGVAHERERIIRNSTDIFVSVPHDCGSIVLILEVYHCLLFLSIFVHFLVWRRHLGIARVNFLIRIWGVLTSSCVIEDAFEVCFCPPFFLLLQIAKLF